MSIQVISFNCILKNKAGLLISSTFNSNVLNSNPEQNPDQNMILHGLTEGLQDLVAGEKRSISLSAEEAYGLYQPSKVILFPRKKLPRQVRVGESISITSKTGTVRAYKVLQLHDDMASLDGNHPLAGQDLVFEIEAISARDATREEISESLNTMTAQLLH